MLTITIMAAGKGSRMKSIIPKVLHLFDGVPFLFKIILECCKLNPRKILVITGSDHNIIESTLIDCFLMNNMPGFELIQFVNQPDPEGTGNAILCTLPYYESGENILILNGDMPLISYNVLNKFIIDSSIDKKEECPETIEISNILIAELENPSGYGRILIVNGYFVGIKEERDCMDQEKEICLVNTGIYYFSESILKKYIPMISNNNSQKEYYLTDIFGIISRESDTRMGTVLIDSSLNYQIMGVNTQDELNRLIEIHNSLHS